MSVNRLVSIEIAINNAIGDMEMQDDRKRPKFMRWAEDAERKIGSFYSLKRKYFELTINSDCHRADLPCGVEAVMGLMYGSQDTCNCDVVFRNAYNYYGNSSAGYYYLVGDGSLIGTPQIRQWEIQDDQIVFLAPLTAGDTIVIDAAYRQMDESGKFLMVPEEHIGAISAYIEYMRARGSRWMPAEQRMTDGDIYRLEKDWGRERRNARALSSEPSPSERAEIVSMLNDPLSGYKGAMWRHWDEFQSAYCL